MNAVTPSRVFVFFITSSKIARRHLLTAGFALFFLAPANLNSADSMADTGAFLRPPALVTQNPDSAHRSDTRRFQGIPSLARTAGGRLWTVWYGGPGKGEDQTNYIVVATSGDDGRAWNEEALVIDPDGVGPVRAFDPELWVDPTGRLWLFWTQALEHDGSVAGVWSMTTRNGDDAKPEWSKPRRLTDGVMMCKPALLSSGEWILSVSTWRRTDLSARMVVSSDLGETWLVRGAAQVPVEWRDYDEHRIIERHDGSLWMLVRLKPPPGEERTVPQLCLGESISEDRGKTWSVLTRGRIPHVHSRFFVERLESGRLLLVKHRDETAVRDGLTAYLSDDDGRSWSAGLMLEAQPCSYPDGVQAKDGRIFITYDRNRSKEGFIKMAVFTEADIFARKIVSPGSRLDVNVARIPQAALDLRKDRP